MLPLLLAITLGAAPPDSVGERAADVRPVYNGQERQLAVAPPRFDASVKVDGVLDEASWAKAAVLTGFSQYQPVDGRPADDSTEVLVWYSPTAIHFGVRAFAQPGSVRATLADRDKMFTDDYIGIFLATFNDQRQALVFGANPHGVQGDGTMLEGTGNGTGGFGGVQQGRPAVDINPDFIFESKGRLTDYGYEIEIRIPFKSLKYQSADPQTWGFNVIRKVQSRGREDSWAPARLAAPTYLGQVGALTGLTGLSRGLVLDINPVLTQHRTGTFDPQGIYGYDTERPQLGGNVRWGISNNLTLNGTIRPDFAEVESDATQYQADPRVAIQYPEKRPFFLDGIEQFNTPSNLIYTRRIVSPLGAVKLTGKIAGSGVAFLSAQDGSVASATGRGHPLYNLLRLQRDLGSVARLGLVYTDKIDGDRSNRVAGIDGRAIFGGLYAAQWQLAGSRTATPGAPTLTAPLWSATLTRSGRNFYFRYSTNAIGDDFDAQSGFISRAGVANATMDHLVTWYGAKGAFVESVSQDVMLNGTWQYRPFLRGEGAQDRKLHFNTNATLRGGWKVGASALVESFGFDERFYARYAIERHDASGAIDTIPFTGTPRIPNLDWLVQVSTPQFKKFAGSIFWLWGHDENFFEWSSAGIRWLQLSSDWRPTDKLRLNGTYSYTAFIRRTDGSLVGDSRIPRIKAEYQVARPLFVRLVGEYDAEYQDALRDDGRTEQPLLIRSGGVYQRQPAVRDNRIRADALIAYQPNPGTVFFAGYGSTMTEPQPLRFRDLVRQQDAFFLKLSYLFRT
jgi:hypothetical protein